MHALPLSCTSPPHVGFLNAVSWPLVLRFLWVLINHIRCYLSVEEEDVCSGPKQDGGLMNLHWLAPSSPSWSPVVLCLTVIADHVQNHFPSDFLLSRYKHRLEIIFYMSKYPSVLNWRQLFLHRWIFERRKILEVMTSHTIVLYMLIFLCTFLYAKKL